MKCLVVYDETGVIYAVRYDATALPNSIKCILQEVDEGSMVLSVDVTDSENPKVLTQLTNESILQNKVTQLEAKVQYYSMMAGEEA